jgi:hypothetical protein
MEEIYGTFEVSKELDIEAAGDDSSNERLDKCPWKNRGDAVNLR